MKKSVIIITCAISLVSLMSSCALDPDSKLNRALERHIAKEPGSLVNLELEFLQYASIESFEGSDIQSNGSLLYRITGSRVDIRYPRRLTLKLADDGEVTQVAADNNHAVITDGLTLSFFSGSGAHRNNVTVGDKKSPVRSLALDSDSVLYYMNTRVYRYSFTDNTTEQAFKETFSSPYTSYYTALIEKKGDLIGVLAGIAGSYRYGIVNAATGSVLLKNLGMSSSRHYLGSKALYYMGGSTGKWELMQLDLATKFKKTIVRFADIIDIEPAAAGYVCETSAGLWTALYGGEKKRIPFPYKLAGSYRGRVLIHYKGVYYFIDMIRLNEGLSLILERDPELSSEIKL